MLSTIREVFIYLKYKFGIIILVYVNVDNSILSL